MSETKSSDNLSVKHFVRKSLGCACPDNIFEDIRKVEHSGYFATANAVYEIGGRLFIAVYVPSDWHEMENKLAQLIDAGKQYRDKHAYNRFRLVIATSDNNADASLQAMFNTLSNIDAKTHLHVIKPEALPFNVRSRHV